jgi:uncharacterized iron-regulated membrane protein
MRQLFLLAHRWLALISSLVLIVTGLTGAILVFEGAIDRGLHPELWRVTPAEASTADATAVTARLPLDTLVARVAAQLPTATITGINTPPEVDRAWTVSAGDRTVFVDPWSGRITGSRTQAESQALLPRRIHVLHTSLLASKIGGEVVAIATLISLFLVCSGLLLWWRDKTLSIREGASWKRIVFDLHHVLGAAAALILLVITASATLIHYDGLAKRLVALDGAPVVPPPTQPAASAVDVAVVSYDRALTEAQRALPGATAMFVSTNGAPKSPVVVAMRFPEDRTPAGRSRVYLNRWTGTVLGVSSTRDAAWGTRLNNTKRSLHTGDVYGMWSQTLWFVASLIMVAQAITGVLVWWNGRPARVAAARRQAAAA